MLVVSSWLTGRFNKADIVSESAMQLDLQHYESVPLRCATADVIEICIWDSRFTAIFVTTRPVRVGRHACQVIEKAGLKSVRGSWLSMSVC